MDASQDDEEYIIDVPDQSFHLTQFHEWYWKRAFNGKSMRSLVVSLPASFVTYLGEDGIIIPRSLGGDESDSDDTRRKRTTMWPTQRRLVLMSFEH